jgi:alpha-ketoglutarate-dependent 2,4-dichlorophenoxyacetate dioxygenase
MHKQLHPLFAAEIFGIDIRRPLDRDEIDEVIGYMDEYAVCVYHNEPPLTNEEQLAFSRHLGPMEEKPILKLVDRKERGLHPQIQDGSNLDENGKVLVEDDIRRIRKLANMFWHTDVSFHRVRATYSLLNAHVIPPAGANTEYADLRAAFDALPASMKERIEGLVAEHSYWHSRMLAAHRPPTDEEQRLNPPAHHPLVSVHPGSGRKTLYLASHASRIVGLPVEEGRALLRELTEFATQPQFVYSHEWRVGDIVIWDNRCTMHRATPFEDTKYPRDVRRTTVRETVVA